MQLATIKRPFPHYDYERWQYVDNRWYSSVSSVGRRIQILKQLNSKRFLVQFYPNPTDQFEISSNNFQRLRFKLS